MCLYDLKGDSRNPGGTVTLENIHVGEVTGFFKNVKDIKKVNESNVTVGKQKAR